MLHPSGVDETLFVQILHAYSARNPMELIVDDAYDACLARMGGDAEGGSEETQLTQSGLELQQRYGAKLFVREDDEGERILVAGTKKRNLQLIPLRRVYATLCELAQAHDQNATQLKQAVKAKVLGIPEEIVQEYCDMAASCAAMDDGVLGEELEDSRKVVSARTGRGTDGTFLRCSACGIMKSYKSFAKHKDQPLGVRSRCKACEMKTRHEKSERLDDMNAVVEGLPSAVRRTKKVSYMGLTGTAICAACGERKPVQEFDKARQKPFTLKCRACTAKNAPLMTKLCCSCQQDLSLDHFYRDSYTKAGFRPRCMNCMKAQKGMQFLMEVPPRVDDPVESDLYLDARTTPVDDQGTNFPSTPSSTTNKRTRSRRNRRKTQKSKEAAEEREVVEDGFVAEISEGRHRTTVRGRGRRKTRRGRGVGKASATISSALLEAVNEEDDAAAEPRAKLGALNSLAAKAQQEEKNKVDGAESEGCGKQGRARGLTGCSTVKDPQGNVTKYCTGCLHFRDANEFGRDVSKPSGLRSRCRRCQKRGRDSQMPGEDKGSAESVRKKIPRKPVRKRGEIAEKICARCNHQKPITEFYRDKSKDDSYASVCKKCAKQAKIRAEKAEKREASQNASKARQMQEVEEVDMELVMSYVDALQPESSAFSADAGEEDDDAISREAPAALHRVCIGCKIDKSWIEFDLNPMLPDGMCPLCKECRRGNGMRGRRSTDHELKRKCLRCGISKSAIHFTKSIFFPNRTSRFCEACRSEEDGMELDVISPTAKRCKMDVDHIEAVDLMDFECDILRAKDPGGGEELWKKCLSESDVDERVRHKSSSNVNFKKGTMPTQVKSDGCTGVTITHHVPAGSDTPAGKQVNDPSKSFVWNGFVPKKTKMTHLFEKQCKRCGETKKREFFYVDKNQLSQLSANCIGCCNAVSDVAR